MVLPSYSPGCRNGSVDKRQHSPLARELGVRGLINIQYAVKKGDVFVLEVNPRASRTVPFLSKATGLPLAKIATKIMIGRSLGEQNITEDPVLKYFSVKESVLPFNRFPGVDIILGPEMKSTGEVMGIDSDMGKAYAKSQIAAGQIFRNQGSIHQREGFRQIRDH
jgi:carbamoyl-phosphate synthase large subunit